MKKILLSVICIIIYCKGADNQFINTTQASLNPPITAIAKKDTLLVEQLLSQNTNNPIETTDNFGNTPLHLAAQNNLLEITQKLLARQANTNTQNKFKETPLYLAIEYKNPQIVFLLLKNNANPNIVNFTGKTALHKLAQHLTLHEKININLLEKLLEVGADINAQDEHRQTPLHITVALASTNQFNDLYKKFAHQLLIHNAQVNIQDSLKETPLHIAVLFHTPKYSYEDIIKELMTKSDLTLKNIYSQTAWEIAEKFKKTIIPMNIKPIKQPDWLSNFVKAPIIKRPDQPLDISTVKYLQKENILSSKASPDHISLEEYLHTDTQSTFFQPTVQSSINTAKTATQTTTQHNSNIPDWYKKMITKK